MKWVSDLQEKPIFSPLVKAWPTNNPSDQSPRISWTGQKSWNVVPCFFFLDSLSAFKRLGILSHAFPSFVSAILQRIESNEKKETRSNVSICIQHAKHWRVYLPLCKAMKGATVWLGRSMDLSNIKSTVRLSSFSKNPRPSVISIRSEAFIRFVDVHSKLSTHWPVFLVQPRIRSCRIGMLLALGNAAV
jgi:hypothetical protein